MPASWDPTSAPGAPSFSLGPGMASMWGAQQPGVWRPQASSRLHLQVTRPCSYSRKSHFDFEEEDVDKLEIR